MIASPILKEQEKLFHRGDHFYDDLIQKIEQAKNEVLIEAYIFEMDKLGAKLISLLKKKATEGIKVYILLDGIGSFSFCPQQLKLLNHQNFHIKFYNPLPLKFSSHKSYSLGELISRQFHGLYWINKRNHKKVYLIDKKIAYIGSLNITRHHSYRLMRGRSWRDTGARINDNRVNHLRDSFFKAWRNYLNPRPQIFPKLDLKPIYLKLNHCINTRQENFRQLLLKIRSANRRIWITNPYFVPDQILVEELKKAAKRGVNVSIIIPRMSDMKIFPLINSFAGRRLAGHGVKIYEYRPRILHAKTFIIDDWCMVGSSNLNSRSLKHDLEVDLVLKTKSAKRELIRQFLYDLTDAELLNRKDILKKYGESLFSDLFFGLIKYWL